MLEFLSQYWYLILFLIFALLLTFILWVKAAKSSAERNREKKEFFARLDREKDPRKRFSEITKEVLDSEPLEDVFEGVVANIQRRIDKTEEENAISFFDSLSAPMRYVYTAFYVFEDSKDGLHEFFKKNTYPIAPLAPEAISAVFGSEIGDVVREQWEIFDEENEEKSVIPEEYELVNKKFKNMTQSLNVNEAVKAYVIENIVHFA